AAQLMGSPVAAEPVATDAEPLAVGAEPLATGAEPLATGAEPVPSDADPVLSDPSRGGEDGWIGPLVDVLDEPVLVLSPLWTDSPLNDSGIDHATPPGVRRWGLSGGSPLGRRLVDTAPELAVDGTIELLVRAYDGAPAGTAGGIRAARIRDRLVVTWPA